MGKFAEHYLKESTNKNHVATTHGSHVELRSKDKQALSSLKHGETHEHPIMHHTEHSQTDQDAKATRDGDHIHFHDSHSGDKIATIHTSALRESVVIGERDRSEFAANHQLASSVGSTGEHHVYVKTRGKKKSIAGPFKSKEEAENHASRKFGDGVASKHELDH